jgi:DNA polymerase
VRQKQRDSLNTLRELLSTTGTEEEQMEAMLSTSEEIKTQLMSNKRFAALLEKLDVDPPMKVSPTTGNLTYAFAKTDDAFTALLEHENPVVQAAVAARLGNKTTIEESRTETFMGVESRGTFPFPLRYSGAAVTFRWSGFDYNVQNMGRASPLRTSIKAPRGFKVVAADLSNIELRLGLYMAGQDDKVELIRNGLDKYLDTATSIFNMTYDDLVALGKKSRERTTGKVVDLSCIAEGSLVLTDRGLVAIEKVLLDDLVWDGVEWVSHDGVIYQGEQNVITYQGLSATPDHKVWTQEGWDIPFREAKSGVHTLANTGAGRAPLRFMGSDWYKGKTKRKTYISTVPLCVWKDRLGKLIKSAIRKINPMPYLCNTLVYSSKREVVGGHKSKEATAETGQCSVSTMQQSERPQLRKLRRKGNTSDVCYSESSCGLYSQDTSVGGLHRGSNRSDRQQQILSTGEYTDSTAKSKYHEPTKHGVNFMERVLNACFRMAFPIRAYTDSALRAFRFYWRTDNTASEDRRCREAQKLARYTGKARVYDILNAGPRHRFTVSGVLVSNCIYGTGADKLRSTLRLQGKVRFKLEETQNMVYLYRDIHDQVVASWRAGDEVLDCIYHGNSMSYLRDGLLQVTPEGIIKPNGMVLTYPDLTWGLNQKKQQEGYSYEQKRKQRDWVYGSKVYQRCIQSLARDIIGFHMLTIDKSYMVVGTVHDEIICLVAEDEVEQAQEFMLGVMRTPPDWCKGLPLDAEIGVGDNYGDAK